MSSFSKALRCPDHATKPADIAAGVRRALAATGTARQVWTVIPEAAARRTARARCGPRWVAVGARAVVPRVVPAVAPLKHVPAHVPTAVVTLGSLRVGCPSSRQQGLGCEATAGLWRAAGESVRRTLPLAKDEAPAPLGNQSPTLRLGRRMGHPRFASAHCRTVLRKIARKRSGPQRCRIRVRLL